MTIRGPLSSGTRLGAYEIVAPIGAGGMGEVYRALDARLGREVAIKVLPAAFATDPDALARFEREMKTLAVLPHPHILAIYDVGREGATAYAVTELLDGETLAEVVARGPIPVRKATEYGVQIARALGATGPASAQAPVTPTPAPPWRTHAVSGAVVAAIAGAFVLGQVLAPTEPTVPPTLTRLTFERGVIRTARFAPDAETIVYGASWNGAPLKMFVARADTAESKPLDLPSGDVVAVSKTGDMLLLTGNATSGVTQGAAAGDVRDRDFTRSGWTVPGHVSRDGRTLLVSTQDAGDSDYSVLVQRLDGSAPVKVGRGRAQALSPDGKWALSITPSEPNRVLLSPTGPGDARQVDVGDLVPRVGVFVPPALTVAVVGTRNGSAAAAIVDVPSGKRTMLDLPELRGRVFGIRRHLGTHVSPDGSLLAIMTDDGKVLAWPLPGGGPPRELAALAPTEMFAGWSSDPARILVARWNGPTARIDALDLTTGQRKTVREIAVSDPAGMLTAADFYVSPDAQTYVYGFVRMLSTLYLVTGLR